MDNKDFIIYSDLAQLEKEYQELIHEAESALASSYSPYSNFTVGAAALLTNGEIVKGANQENASYPAGLCAERVALFQAGAVHPNEAILKLAVVAKRRNENNLRAGGPCGMCRQVMLEFENKHKQPMEIIFRIENNQWVIAKTAASLLPFSFGKDNL